MCKAGNLRAVCLLLMASAVVGLANAGVSTEVIVIDLPGGEIPAGGSISELAIQQFDPSGGRELVSIQLSALSDFDGVIGIENTDPIHPAFYEVGLLWGIEFWRPDESLLFAMDADDSLQGLLNPYDGETDFRGFSGATLHMSADDAVAATTTTDPADLDLFTGDGTVILTVPADYESSASLTGSSSYESDTWDVVYEGQLTVTYTYVPEPASLAGLAIGVLALLKTSGRR